MTLSEFAAAAGVSKVAISKKKIAHSTNSDGSFFYDPNHPEVQAYLNRKPRERRAAQAKKAKSAKKKAEQKPEVNPEYEPLATPPKKPPRTVYAPQPSGYQSDDPDTRNMELKNQKLELDIAKSRGDLIPKKMARDYQARIYEADTTQLRQLPDRLAGRLSGEARGAESEAAATIQVMATMAEEIDRILENVARIMREFRKHTQPAVFAVEHGAEIDGDEEQAE